MKFLHKIYEPISLMIVTLKNSRCRERRPWQMRKFIQEVQHMDGKLQDMDRNGGMLWDRVKVWYWKRRKSRNGKH